MNQKEFINKRLNCNSSKEPYFRDLAVALVERDWSWDAAVELVNKHSDEILNMYERDEMDTEGIADSLDREYSTVNTYSRNSIEELKNNLIEAYAPVYKGDPEGFESLKNHILSSDVIGLKKDIDAELSNWNESDPGMAEAIKVVKEVKKELESYSKTNTYSKKLPISDSVFNEIEEFLKSKGLDIIDSHKESNDPSDFKRVSFIFRDNNVDLSELGKEFQSRFNRFWDFHTITSIKPAATELVIFNKDAIKGYSKTNTYSAEYQNAKTLFEKLKNKLNKSRIFVNSDQPDVFFYNYAGSSYKIGIYGNVVNVFNYDTGNDYDIRSESDINMVTNRM